MSNTIPAIEPSGSADAKRLVRDGTIVGMLLKMSNDRWGVYDTQEQALTKRTFTTTRKARAAFLEIEAANAQQGESQ